MGNYRTDFLLRRYGFLAGVGSILSIAGNYHDFASRQSGEMADVAALAQDWGMVGQDLRDAHLKFISRNLDKITSQ